MSRVAPPWWKRFPVITSNTDSSTGTLTISARTPSWIEHFTTLYRARRAWIAQGRPTDRAVVLQPGQVIYQHWTDSWQIAGWRWDGRHVHKYREPTFPGEVVINGWSVDELRIWGQQVDR